MPAYRVIFEIDISDARTPKAAARQAYDHLLNGGMLPVAVTIEQDQLQEVVVDLEEVGLG